MIAEKPQARMSPSEWLAITKYFPHSTFDADQKSWIVTDFIGDNENHPQLQKAIAKIISRYELRNIDERTPRRTHVSIPDVQPAGRSAFEELAEEYGLKSEEVVEGQQPVEGESSEPCLVLQDQIKMQVPKEAKVKLYPRGLRCDNCEHYEVPRDPSKITSLVCKECKTGRMRQISLLFFCDRCGEQLEIVPVSMDPDKDGPEFSCTENGCGGFLHLHMGKKLTDMSWVCGTTHTDFGQVRYMCRYCSDFANRKYKRMEIVPTTKAYLRPMTSAFVYFGDNRGTTITNEDVVWRLGIAGDLYNEQRETLREFGIFDVSAIETVESIRAVYGYSPYGDDVKVRFFKEKSRETGQFEYKAYITKTKGKGLVVELDKFKVCQVVLSSMNNKAIGGLIDKEISEKVKDCLIQLKSGKGNIDEIYSWLGQSAKETLNEDPSVQSPFLDLFRLLHSIEHLLTYQAAIVTGLEENSFGGMVMIDKCAILVYETANVEAGGIDYICKEKLPDWINESVSWVRDCKYDCIDGCVKCLFIKDPMCHPFWPTEVDSSYIPPNSLLGRSLVSAFWGLPAPGGEIRAGS